MGCGSLLNFRGMPWSVYILDSFYSLRVASQVKRFYESQLPWGALGAQGRGEGLAAGRAGSAHGQQALRLLKVQLRAQLAGRGPQNAPSEGQ